MNRSRHAPAVTSLPQAPQDEATGRVRRYVLTMVIRMVCFALTIFVTPYGWYTWVFAIATAVLPYIAVVFANAISPTTSVPAESPTQQLSAPTQNDVVPDDRTPDASTIIVQESRGETAAPASDEQSQRKAQGAARERDEDGSA